jgi:hypothetical protein
MKEKDGNAAALELIETEIHAKRFCRFFTRVQFIYIGHQLAIAAKQVL